MRSRWATSVRDRDGDRTALQCRREFPQAAILTVELRALQAWARLRINACSELRRSPQQVLALGAHLARRWRDRNSTPLAGALITSPSVNGDGYGGRGGVSDGTTEAARAI